MKGIGNELIKATLGLLFFIIVLDWALQFLLQPEVLTALAVVFLGYIIVKWLMNRTGGGGGGLLLR